MMLQVPVDNRNLWYILQPTPRLRMSFPYYNMPRNLCLLQVRPSLHDGRSI